MLNGRAACFIKSALNTLQAKQDASFRSAKADTFISFDFC